MIRQHGSRSDEPICCCATRWRVRRWSGGCPAGRACCDRPPASGAAAPPQVIQRVQVREAMPDGARQRIVAVERDSPIGRDRDFAFAMALGADVSSARHRRRAGRIEQRRGAGARHRRPRMLLRNARHGPPERSAPLQGTAVVAPGARARRSRGPRGAHPVHGTGHSAHASSASLESHMPLPSPCVDNAVVAVGRSRHRRTGRSLREGEP
jgi:hypothetical protein